jgi:hypothetical protein
MRAISKSSLLLVLCCVVLALTSCKMKFLPDEPVAATPVAAHEEYNASLSRWEGFDEANVMVWFEKRTPTGQATTLAVASAVEHYTVAGAQVWKWTKASEAIPVAQGGGNRQTTTNYLPGTKGAWKRDTKIVDDSGIRPSGTPPGNATTRAIQWRYNATDALQSYTISDSDANNLVGVYEYSGSGKLQSAVFYQNSALAGSLGKHLLKCFYDSAEQLVAYERTIYDAQNRWTALLRYAPAAGLIVYQDGGSPSLELWTWPAEGVQADPDAPPADADTWASHVSVAADSAGALSPIGAELRSYSSFGSVLKQASRKLYAGATLSEQWLSTYVASGDIGRSGRSEPASGGAETGTVTVQLPGSGSRALGDSSSGAGLSVPSLDLPATPLPALPSGTLTLHDVAMEEKDYSLWYYDANRGALQADFVAPARPLRTVFTPVLDSTNAYGLAALKGQPLTLAMSYDGSARPIGQSLSWNGRERYGLAQSYNASGLVDRIDVSAQVVSPDGASSTPVHIYATASYRVDCKPDEIGIGFVGSADAQEHLLFTLKPVYGGVGSAPPSPPAWLPSIDPIWLGLRIAGGVAGQALTELQLFDGAGPAAVPGKLPAGHYVIAYNYDGQGSTKMDVRSLASGVEGPITAELAFRHDAQGRTTALEAYLADGGVVRASPEWRYAFDYGSVVAAGQVAVDQLIAKRKFLADGALDVYQGLASLDPTTMAEDLLQGLFVNMGF